MKSIGEYIQMLREKIGHERLMLAGCTVIVYRDGKILLNRRADNGQWMGTSGGYIEMGETPEKAASRELLEETGLIANHLELACVHGGDKFYHTYANGDKVAIIDICYICEDFGGEINPALDEVTELRWFDMDDLPDNLLNLAKHNVTKCIEIIKMRK